MELRNKNTEMMRMELGFLYPKCSIPNTCLTGILKCEEFVFRMYSLKRSGATIGDREVLDVLKSIYESRKNWNREGFPHDLQMGDARRTINHLERALNGGENVGQV